MSGKMTNDEVAKRVTRGTTTPWTKVQVIYNDGKFALVKWPGDRREKVSPWVEQYTIDKLQSGVNSSSMLGQTVWDSEQHGRLTNRRVAELIVSLRLELDGIQPKESKPTTVVHSRYQARKKKPAKERNTQLETRAVKVVLKIVGAIPSEWEYIVSQVKLAGSVVDKISPWYIVLEYKTLTDCVEFISGDRESLLDALDNAG